MDKRTKEYKQWLKDNPQGLGDKVEHLLNETALKPVTNAIKKVLFKDGKDCGCNQRREKLNKLFPVRYKAVRCFTEDEYIEYKAFKEHRTIRFSMDQLKYVSKLFSDIFGTQIFTPCLSCSQRPIYDMIDKLDKVFDSYEKSI